MRRYHKAVFTKPSHWQTLKDYSERLNTLKWQYTDHCLDNVKSRAIDLEGLLLYIRGLRLEVEQIFEYYLTDNDEPIRICYRIPYIKDLDIILILGEDKEIITIYLNSKDDLHFTLKKELYQKS
jgi:hypothetical protein